MTDADKIMNPLHFGSDPADIQIRINPEIRIRIPAHFGLILALAECCALWTRSIFYFVQRQCVTWLQYVGEAD